jgi:hypothetical protein
MSGLLSFFIIDYIPDKYVQPDPFDTFIKCYFAFTALFFFVSLCILFALIYCKHNKNYKDDEICPYMSPFYYNY